MSRWDERGKTVYYNWTPDLTRAPYRWLMKCKKLAKLLSLPLLFSPPADRLIFHSFEAATKMRPSLPTNPHTYVQFGLALECASDRGLHHGIALHVVRRAGTYVRNRLTSVHAHRLDLFTIVHDNHVTVAGRLRHHERRMRRGGRRGARWRRTRAHRRGAGRSWWWRQWRRRWRRKTSHKDTAIALGHLDPDHGRCDRCGSIIVIQTAIVLLQVQWTQWIWARGRRRRRWRRRGIGRRVHPVMHVLLLM